MLQQDWFMRQIELAARILAAVVRTAATGQRMEALAMLDQAYQPLIGTGARVVPYLPDAQLLDLLAPGGVPDHRRWPLVAQLLVVEADLRAEEGDHDGALTRYHKAAVLIDRLGGDAPPDPACAAKAADGLRTYRLPVPARVLAARLYERTGRYADAEDTIFEGIDFAGLDAARLGAESLDAEGAAGDAEPLVDAGIEMYRRLLAKDDADLDGGNLPRGEVEDGLAELLRRPPRPL